MKSDSVYTRGVFSYVTEHTQAQSCEHAVRCSTVTTNCLLAGVVSKLSVRSLAQL